jgi:hypothetical protein
LLSVKAVLNDKGTVILRTRAIETLHKHSVELGAIVNLKKINEIRRINKLFEEANRHLKTGSVMIGLRRSERATKEPGSIKNSRRILSSIVYIIDFIFRRMMPKLQLGAGKLISW